MKITALVKLKRKARGELSLMVDMCFHGSPARVSDANPRCKMGGSLLHLARERHVPSADETPQTGRLVHHSEQFNINVFITICYAGRPVFIKT